MRKVSHKYRAYPTDEQAKLLAKTFGCVRFVWNQILDWRSKEYTLNKTKIGYLESSKKLTALKQSPEAAWLKDVSCVPLQQALRHQDVAFSNFFAKRAKYPNFKSKHDRQSAQFTSSAFRIKDGKLYIAKSDAPLAFKLSRPLPDRVSSITISKDKAGRYFVAFQGEKDIQELPKLDNSIGLDMGLQSFIATSNGEKIAPPKAYLKNQERLARYQRRMARKVKGSNNRNKARLRVARIHARIADIRRDFLHKLSTKIIRENQTITVESLNVSGLLKNRSLAKHIADAGWSEFLRQIRYKADWYGRKVVELSQWFPSSQICSACGHRDGKKSLNVRQWVCSACGAIHDRDTNAAININTAGLAEINACQI